MFNQIVCQQRAGRTLRAIRGNNQEKALKALKSELAALDRKITAELAPKHDETADGEKIKPTAVYHQQPANNPPPQSTKQQEDKSILVAEPHLIYQTEHPLRSTYRPIGL